MCSIITSTPTDRVNEYHGPHREIEPTSVRERKEAMERLQRATDPEVMDEQRVNMQRRLNPLTAYVPTSPVSQDHQYQTHQVAYRLSKDLSQRSSI